VSGETAGRSLGAGALRELAERHGVRPKRGLGQHFLINPNLARAIAADAEVGPGDRVVEIGAGLGSLTRALAEAGADVLAVEVDPGLIPALQESVSGLDRVRVLHADATDPEWREELGDDRWVLAANLPYNVATHLVLSALRDVPQVVRLVVMVQREVGERLVAEPGSKTYGVPSLRVAYRAEGGIVRRVPPAVFWPRPKVESVIVRLVRRSEPPVAVEEGRLWTVVDAAFAERRKTIRNALRRLGIDDGEADRALALAGLDVSVRGEALSLSEFAVLVDALPPESLDRAAASAGAAGS
jgi:16S rRNA (adenine1518-N6/adenine1519-N6)-dimethyltransferase